MQAKNPATSQREKPAVPEGMFAQGVARPRKRVAKLLAGQVGKQPLPPLNSLPSSLEMSRDDPTRGWRHPAQHRLARPEAGW